MQTRDRSTVGIAFTDTNGNFSVGVISNLWGISVDSASAALHGYVQFQNKVTAAISNNNVSGLSIGLPKATAFFYGTVKDGSGNPISGVVAMYANDQNNGLYESDGYTDTNGNFVTGVIGGLGTGDPWSLGVDNAGNFTNYVFSQPAFSQSGTNISTGQAVLANLTALTATNQISGNVKFNGTNLAGVQVYAYATIGTNSYYTEADTDTNGNYSFNVPGGSWTVDVYDCGCSDNDSLNNVISGGNYQAPASQNVVINGSGATVNFTVPYCGGVQITTTSPLPAAQQGNYYYTQLQATDCNDNFIWSLNDLADFPSGIGLSFDSSGEIYGEPSGYGTYNFSVNVSDGNGHSATQSLSLTISQGATPLQINTYGLSNAIQNASCYYTLSASGGQLPYTWSLLTGSANLPAGVSLSSSGIISGTPIGSGTDNFIVQVTDSASNNVYQPLSLTVSPSSLPQSIALKLLPPSGASLQFSFKAASGVTYTVQSSTNLKTWSKYETFTSATASPLPAPRGPSPFPTPSPRGEPTIA